MSELESVWVFNGARSMFPPPEFATAVLHFGFIRVRTCRRLGQPNSAGAVR